MKALVLIGLGLLPTHLPDLSERLLDEVERDWRRLEAIELAANPWRDKQRLVPDLGRLLEEERARDRDRTRAARDLERWLDDRAEAPGALAWRVHELRARLLAGVDDDDAADALQAAVAAYPRVDYPEPAKHSSFHHLVNEAGLARWDADGRRPALEQTLAVLGDDPRLAAFWLDPWVERFAAEADLDGLAAFVASAAEAVRPRLPAVAGDLDAWTAPDLRFVDGDARRRYLVLGANTPGADASAPTGPRDLIVVLPGGNGQALDFRPWLEELCAPLTDRALFAVLSAPVWSAEQAEEWVWVTDGVRRRYGAEFPVEEFAREVARELSAATDGIERCFLFAWSSGGPAAYATLLDRDATFAGAYVLSSVFKPEQLDLRRARGRRLWLEQGRDDRVTPLRFAETAERELTEAGAEVHLEVFDGGHGFAMPDPARSLARALAWLAADDGASGAGPR